MYSLLVFYAGSPSAHESTGAERASDVLTLLPQLLERHPGCEKITVMMGATPLFAVDCKGSTVEI